MEIGELERRAQICADEYGGILPHTEAFFLQSILYSASRCLKTFSRYHSMRKNDQTEAEELVSVVQEAVGHAAALSRYFWPSPQGKRNRPEQQRLKEQRGKTLRVAFCIDADSPLYNRDLRNAWEHFDERLDEYCLENDAGYFFPTCILGEHSLADDPRGHIFKLLDTSERCLVLMDVKYFFGPIEEAVREIFTHAKTADNKEAKLPRSGNGL